MDSRVAREEVGPWDVEEIPNDDVLYLRVHTNDVDNGRPTPGAFRNRASPYAPHQPSAMSSDWCRYSTAQETQRRARIPELNGVVALPVLAVRHVPLQAVVHNPLFPTAVNPGCPNNRAHTDITGPKSPDEARPSDRPVVLEVRARLTEMATWAIDPP
jgi:hypothetical protein